MAAEYEKLPITEDDDFTAFLALEQFEANQHEYNRLAEMNTSHFTRDQLRAHRKERKTLKKSKKKQMVEQIKKFEEVYYKGEPHAMSKKYQDAVEEGLVRFFRRGYEKYWNDGEPAEDHVILEFLKKLIQQYGLLISGGFVLKNLGLTSEARTKPSVDVDIFIPSNTPDKYPDFYDTMAKVFDADRNKEKNDWVAKKVYTHRRPESNQLRSRNIFSVHSYERDVGKGDDIYAKMDLVRPYEGVNAKMIIRHFDMSICMNWYDGKHLYSVDSAAIFKKKAGYFNPRYLHFVFDEESQTGKRERDRIVKYILRGYRLKYMDPVTGKLKEFKTSDFPNAIERMNLPQREMYYRNHPHERPAGYRSTRNRHNSHNRHNRHKNNNQKNNNQHR